MSTLSTDTKESPGPFDVVALKQDLLRTDVNETIEAGARGAIVDLLPNGVYEVEFSDSFGNSIYIAHLRAEQVELVWSYERHKTTENFRTIPDDTLMNTEYASNIKGRPESKTAEASS